MSGKRQKTQDSLALAPNGRGETRAVGSLRAEPLMAKPAPESAAVTERLMEEVCDRENLQSAWKRVQRNQGSPGVDGMSIDDAKDYLREHWPSIRSRLLDGTYQPQPVKRVEIPKPDGGVRKLGVPCVALAFDEYGLRGPLPARPARDASYSVSVRQGRGFAPHFLQTSPRGDALVL
jgi:RNA-directed DNA polymerase